MAVKHFSTGKTDILASARGNMHATPKQLENIPGGLYPLKMALWNTDEYRIANGWPVPVPDLDVRARSLVSAEGEVLAYRQKPRAAITGANVRWLADDEMYDVTDLQWYPYQNDFPLIWTTASDYAPTYISDYEYQIGAELFTEQALNFDSDSAEHMWTDMGAMLGGAAGYSVVMCASLNSVYGNNQTVPYSGLWCPGMATPAVGQTISETPDGGWVSLTLQGNSLYLETDQTPRKKALSISHLLSTSAPVMIALVFSRPYASLYAGHGPSSISRATVNVGAQTVAMDGHVVLGRTNGDISHTADMALMDLGLYADQLTPAQVKDEFSVLSSVYGGDK